MKKRLIFGLCIAVTIIGFVGCSSKSKNNDMAPAIKVNGEKLTIREYDREMDRTKKIMEAAGYNIKDNAAMLSQIKNQVIDQLTTKRIELQAAKDEKVFIDEENVRKKTREIQALYGSTENFTGMLESQDMTLDEFTQNIRYQMSKDALFRLVTKDLKVNDTDIENFYNQSPQEASKLKIRMILVSTKNRSDAVAKDEAQGIIRELASGSSFEQIARTKSDDAATRENGGLMMNPARKGDLYVTSGQIGGEAELASFNLKAGEFTRVPLLSPQGYMILKVEEIKKLSLSEAKAVLAGRLLQTKKTNVYNEYIRKARDKAKIEIFVDKE